MANKNRYTPKQVADALTETKGMVYIAAQRLGCSVETIRTYCNRYPLVRAARDAQRGLMIDTAELKLWQSIQNGEAWGISLCLKTIGKDRGYIERQELTGEDGTPLTLRVVYEDAIDVTPVPLQIEAPPVDMTVVYEDGQNGTAEERNGST